MGETEVNGAEGRRKRGAGAASIKQLEKRTKDRDILHLSLGRFREGAFSRGGSACLLNGRSERRGSIPQPRTAAKSRASSRSNAVWEK